MTAEERARLIEIIEDARIKGMSPTLCLDMKYCVRIRDEIRRVDAMEKALRELLHFLELEGRDIQNEYYLAQAKLALGDA